MNDYIVIESKDLASLCKRVVEGMEDSYYPLGNITVFEGYVNDPEEVKIDRIFYQAMASYKQ